MARDVISAARATALLNSHGGPALVLVSDTNVAFPTKIDDVVIIDPSAGVQWAPQTGWSSLGITRGGVNVSRGFEEYKRDADQSYGPYDTRPTAWSTMVSTELVETSPVAMQLAWVGGAIATTAKAQTALGAGASAGAVTVTVGSASGIVSGDYISVGNGPAQEWTKVTNVSGTTLTISSGLAYAHVSGELVVRFGTNTLSFGTSRNLPPKQIAVLAPVNFDDPTAGGVVNGLRLWAFRRAKLEAGQRQISMSNSADWTLPVSFYCYPDLTQSDPEFDTFVMYEYAY